MRDTNFTAKIFKHVSAINIRILTLVSLLPLILLALVSSQATAAVQMGGHLDFVLKNGTTVRVFPEATKTKTLRPKRVRNRKMKGNLKPKGGDPCKRLEDEYKRKTTKKKAKKKKVNKPPWVKPTKGLKSAGNFSRFLRRNKPTGWYYIPMEPRLSYKAGKPEATFIKFMTDEAEGKNSAEGGIFHLMVTYGLTKKEEKELRKLLEKAVPGAQLKGAVDLQPSKSGDNFIVTSGTLSDEGFAPKGVLSSGRAPSMVGGKAAVAGRLSGLGAQLMETTFKNSTADMSVTFNYDYIVKTPAFRGQVLIHLDKIQETANCNLRTQKTKTKSTWKFKLRPWGFSLKKKKEIQHISRKDLEESYNTMLSNGAVEIRIDQELPEADVSAIEASLMEMAMSSFTNMQKSFMNDKELEGRNKKAKKAKSPKAPNYEMYTLTRKRTKMSGTITLNIEKGVAIYRTHSMTGNMGIPMRKHRKHIFSEVLLNDPFFKRGKITVDLDMEALDLFEGKMVNNASVKVIVPFKKRPFTDDDVFTRTSIEKGDIVKEFSFATRGDKVVNSDCPFRYLESWSLKGGGKWPKNQKEKCSREMVVTLVPPIKTRRIDVEADLDEMERTGIRGADVLLKYTLYGKEKVDTVRFRAAKPEPYIEQTIYVDKDASDVEYKVILTHAKEGKLPQPDWTELEDNFIYTSLAELPASYLEEIKAKIPEAKELVEEIIEIIEEVNEPVEEPKEPTE